MGPKLMTYNIHLVGLYQGPPKVHGELSECLENISVEQNLQLPATCIHLGHILEGY